MYYRIICLLIGYAIGCIQIAYMMGKHVGGIDIREHGSGNAGTTNVVRVMGAKIGILVFVLDLAKGMVAFVLCSAIFGGGSAYSSGALGLIPGLYGALGAVLGHDFPIQLKGRGGKGSATTIGIVLLLDWRIALICYLSGAVTLVFTRYVSATSILIACLMAVLLAMFAYQPEVVCIGAILAALSLYQHRANISRLVRGEAKKIKFKKQG